MLDTSLVETLLEHKTTAMPLELGSENKRLQQTIQTLIEDLPQADESLLTDYHQLLATLNKMRFSIDTKQSPPLELRLNSICTALETAWLNRERKFIQERLSRAPMEQASFIKWFEALEGNGYGQNHPLFLYLAERANWDDFKYFLQQEMSSEAGFDDLIAMTQVKAPTELKMEMAANYWDEMGKGHVDGLHGKMLVRLAERFELCLSNTIEAVHWAPLALSNTMVALATKRSYFNQAVGALGVIELTAPSRCVYVRDGLKRLGLSSAEYKYYSLHAVIDREHWSGWRQHVVEPLIESQPASMYEIAEGALLRLLAGLHCFNAYSHHLALSTTAPPLPDMVTTPS